MALEMELDLGSDANLNATNPCRSAESISINRECRCSPAIFLGQSLVDRNFTAIRPHQLWVSDCTYVATWRGFVNSRSSSDVFARRIVGWRVSSSLATDVVLDALEQAQARLHLREAFEWLKELPDEQCAAMVLRGLEGLSTKETAEVLGCSEGAVEQRLVRAREALRRRSER